MDRKPNQLLLFAQLYNSHKFSFSTITLHHGCQALTTLKLNQMNVKLLVFLRICGAGEPEHEGDEGRYSRG